MKPITVLACICLSACAANPFTGDAATHTVNLDGKTYLISQLTAGTWTATASGLLRKTLADDAAGKAALLSAIEKTSGCKVTDSDYSRRGMQLDAQVDCGKGLKN